MKMPIYYIIYFESLVSCYLIKEGYIPCKDYRKNPYDYYYAAYSRDQFCIACPSDKENIFENKQKAIESLKNKIEINFNKNIRNLIEKRTEILNNLKTL